MVDWSDSSRVSNACSSMPCVCARYKLALSRVRQDKTKVESGMGRQALGTIYACDVRERDVTRGREWRGEHWEGNYVQTAIWGRRGQAGSAWCSPQSSKKDPRRVSSAPARVELRPITTAAVAILRPNEETKSTVLAGSNSNAMPSRLKIQGWFCLSIFLKPLSIVLPSGLQPFHLTRASQTKDWFPPIRPSALKAAWPSSSAEQDGVVTMGGDKSFRQLLVANPVAASASGQTRAPAIRHVPSRAVAAPRRPRPPENY